MVFRPTAEEHLNTLTHAFGLVLSVAGAGVLLTSAFTHADHWRAIGCAMYAVALVGVYCCSTLSHSASQPDLKHLFRCLDQGFIYLLIVGTYTPFALAFLRTGWWLLFLAAMWTLAGLGFVSKMVARHRIDSVAVWIYLILGWMPLVAGFQLIHIVPATALWWMLFGGLCYTVGTVFLALDQHIPQLHAVWHLFVIAGSSFHFFAILLFVAREPIAA